MMRRMLRTVQNDESSVTAANMNINRIKLLAESCESVRHVKLCCMNHIYYLRYHQKALQLSCAHLQPSALHPELPTSRPP